MRIKHVVASVAMAVLLDLALLGLLVGVSAATLVPEVQECLAMMGYYEGPMDGGIIGSKMHRAWEQWMRERFGRLHASVTVDTVSKLFVVECELLRKDVMSERGQWFIDHDPSDSLPIREW